VILREFTNDVDAFAEVYWQNEYRLPDQIGPDDVILDIGAHIGCFALACVKRGAKRVVCYEPEASNFALLARNTAPYLQYVEIHNAAVWRSDRVEQTRIVYGGKGRTTDCQIFSDYGDIVHSVQFDTILKNLGKVRLCKLDCEGSEYPILYTSKELARVREFAGESHEHLKYVGCPQECSINGIVNFLNNNGFEAEGVRNPRGGGAVYWFFAKRKAT